MIPFGKDFIDKCKQGDQRAQKQLFEKLYAQMYRVCFRYIGKQADPEDCLMRAFMKAFQKLDTFQHDGDHSLFFWIRKIMVNESLMEIRKMNSSLMVVQQDEVPDAKIEENVLDLLSAEELYKLVTDLPVGYRTVFNLFVIEGYSHQEIAETMGISENTSKTQLLKARQRLRSSIEKMNGNYESYAG